MARDRTFINTDRPPSRGVCAVAAMTIGNGSQSLRANAHIELMRFREHSNAGMDARMNAATEIAAGISEAGQTTS